MRVSNQPHAPHESVVSKHRLPLQPHPIRKPKASAGRQSLFTPPLPLRFHRRHAIPECGRQQSLRQHGALIPARGLPRHKLNERLARRQQRVVVQQPPRLPEVRVRRAVARIEQPRQLPEVPVLPIIHLLVHQPRGSRYRRVFQRGHDNGGGKRGISQRKMNSRRKQRVDEAAGVPDQYVAGPRQRLAAVRPVSHHLRPRDHFRAFKHACEIGRGGYLPFEEAARAHLADAPLPRLRVHHRAHARPAFAQRPTQRNMPQPPVSLRLDEDVAAVRLRQPLAALVVAVHRQVAKEVVPLPQLQLPRQHAALPARVHDILGWQFDFAAIL